MIEASLMGPGKDLYPCYMYVGLAVTGEEVAQTLAWR
jgi:hypothetical protein